MKTFGIFAVQGAALLLLAGAADAAGVGITGTTSPAGSAGDPGMQTQPAPTPGDAMAPADTRTHSATQASPLVTLRNPPSKIALASVLDSKGELVGAVQRVQLSPAGTPTRVDIALLGAQEHIVSLDAGKLSYDQQSNVVTAEASAAQLKAMPNKG